MYFTKIGFAACMLVSITLVNGATLDRRLTKSKLNQYTGISCDGANLYGQTNIPKDTCIDIDATTHSIYLARGEGLTYARNMYAYAKTGCPKEEKIEKFYDHDSGSACMNVDWQMLGLAGTEVSNGRIMSVKFTGV